MRFVSTPVLATAYFFCALLLAWLDMVYLQAWDEKRAWRAGAVDFCRTGLSGLFVVMLVFECFWVVPLDMLANGIASYWGTKRRQ